MTYLQEAAALCPQHLVPAGEPWLPEEALSLAAAELWLLAEEGPCSRQAKVVAGVCSLYAISYAQLVTQRAQIALDRLHRFARRKRRGFFGPAQDRTAQVRDNRVESRVPSVLEAISPYHRDQTREGCTSNAEGARCKLPRPKVAS